MEIRIKFSAEVYIKGDDMNEIKSKFEDMPLFSADAIEDCGAEFGEILLVEDAETYKDMMNEYNKC